MFPNQNNYKYLKDDLSIDKASVDSTDALSVKSTPPKPIYILVTY